MNKKILFLFCMLMALNSQADSLIGDAPAKFYFSLGAGVVGMQRPGVDEMPNQTFVSGVTFGNNRRTVPLDFTVPQTQFSHAKFKNVIVPSVALGYYIHPKLRLELAYIKPFIKDFESLKDSSIMLVRLNQDRPAVYRVRHHVNIDAVNLRASFDVIPVKDYGALYISGGYGVSRILLESSIGANVDFGNFKQYISAKQKEIKYTSNWLFGIGANINLADGIKLNLGYEIQNFGNVKARNYQDQNPNFSTSSKTFKGQGAIMRIIYDI